MLISILVFIWLAATLVQLYYWLLVVWPLEASAVRRSSRRDPVSVIICANGSSDTLPGLVEAILREDYPDFELIVVNDGPSEEVNKQCEIYRENERFRVIPFERKPDSPAGKKGPLEEGVRHARYEWPLLTDSDCEIRKGWISAMMDHVTAKSKLVLGYSPMKQTTALAGKLSAFDTVLIACQYLGWALRDRTYMGVGRNILYHKELYEEVDGFLSHHDLPSGDDDLLVQEMGLLTKAAVCLDHEGIVYSAPKTTWKDLVRQKLRHISTADRYDKRSGRLVWLMGMSFTVFWLLLPVVLLFAPGIPMLIAGAAILSQWWVFVRVSKPLEAQRFVVAFPLWSLLYAVFLVYLGLLKIIGRTPGTWN